MSQPGQPRESGHEGVFVVFEGIDGAGTTTQAEAYAAHLRRSLRPVHVTHEPSEGPIGLLLRNGLTGRVLLGGAGSRQASTMALLFAADRLDHVAYEIDPHLREGSVVLCDRYDLSSIAYQSATSTQDDGYVQWIREINRMARRPHVTLVLDVEPKEADRRRRERSGAPELYEEAELQRRLAGLYAQAEMLVPGDRIIHVDGNRTVDEVAAAIRIQLWSIVGA